MFLWAQNPSETVFLGQRSSAKAKAKSSTENFKPREGRILGRDNRGHDGPGDCQICIVPEDAAFIGWGIQIGAGISDVGGFADNTIAVGEIGGKV